MPFVLVSQRAGRRSMTQGGAATALVKAGDEASRSAVAKAVDEFFATKARLGLHVALLLLPSSQPELYCFQRCVASRIVWICLLTLVFVAVLLGSPRSVRISHSIAALLIQAASGSKPATDLTVTRTYDADFSGIGPSRAHHAVARLVRDYDVKVPRICFGCVFLFPSSLLRCERPLCKLSVLTFLFVGAQC
jgi:hypothetical protein